MVFFLMKNMKMFLTWYCFFFKCQTCILSETNFYLISVPEKVRK